MSSIQAQVTPSRVAARGSDPATGVYLKLAFFSVALFAAPLTAYYFSRDRVFGGNPTYAGGLAAFVANLVLVAYVVAAFMEDQGEGKKDLTREQLQARLRKMDEDESSIVNKKSQ